MSPIFIETYSGAVNLSTIRYVEKSSGKVIGSRLYSDNEVSETSLDPEDICRLTRSVVPAFPGFFQLRAYDDYEGGFFTTRLPIIAWRVDEMAPEPVAVDDPDARAISEAILCPDGQVVQPYDRNWDNQQEWEKDVAKIATQRKAEADALHNPQ